MRKIFTREAIIATIIAVIVAIVIGTLYFFGYHENKIETSTRCNVKITTPVMTTINLQGKEYKINENDPVERDYENGQKIYKAEDGTYIGWIAAGYTEYESYGRDTNGESYSTGTQREYLYKWMVVPENWDIHTITEAHSKTIYGEHELITPNNNSIIIESK